MPHETQNYANHRRYFPLFHFVVVPILALNLIFAVVYAVRHPGGKMNWWQVVVAFALAGFTFTARVMVLSVQNRIIRLEETLRMQRCLPEELRARIGELRTSHFIALRFCSDEELPEMTRAVLAGELRDQEAIKKRVKSWRADFLRA